MRLPKRTYLLRPQVSNYIVVYVSEWQSSTSNICNICLVIHLIRKFHLTLWNSILHNQLGSRLEVDYILIYLHIPRPSMVQHPTSLTPWWTWTTGRCPPTTTSGSAPPLHPCRPQGRPPWPPQIHRNSKVATTALIEEKTNLVEILLSLPIFISISSR